ncbi:MAG TPA: transglycosylase SLT domain-containing protein [Rhodanobacteraceae bacterium]|nr:transglycosylase SLT domain-containing protein [Rhodanobacteraceae bacterium]
MPNPFRRPALAVACLFFATTCIFPASARSNRVEALNQRMATAEAQYTQALDDADAGDDGARARADTALKQMEGAVADCGRTRGCDLQAILATYKRLLERPVVDDMDDEDDDLDPVDVTGNGVPASASADALLDANNRRFVQRVQFNPAVQAGIRRWLTDMRPALMNSYENFQYLKPQMAPAFQRANLPEALLFGILAKESNGKVHAGSRAGAVGPLQFMPSTGRRFGLGDDGSGFDTRYDPRSAAQAAASYLQERYAELNNSIEMSLAAYNGGEGRALRAFQSSGGRSFWDADVYNQFPAETRDYVPMVIAAAWLYLHPREYGLRWPRVSSHPSAMRLQRPASLNELGICLGNARYNDGYLRALRNLNPRYDANIPLPAGTMLTVTTRIAGLYNRYCVQGERADLARQLMASDARTAVVQIGEIGPVPQTTTTYVPGQGAVQATVATGKPAPVRKSMPAKTHTVRRGETLTRVAQQYQCDMRVLAKANGIKPPRYMVRPGQRLKLEGCRE